MQRTPGLEIIPLIGLPEFTPDHSLATEIVRSLVGIAVDDGDVLAVTSKVVSKVEGCFVPAAERAELIARDTVRVVARMRGPNASAIVENRLGVVAAAAGVDASNVAGDWVLALPEDPDASARRLASELRDALGIDLGIVITDTVGRPWRYGQTDIAIGSANIALYADERGGVDTAGKPLTVTQRCVADEIAAASDLVKGKTAGIPVALVRGMSEYVIPGTDQRARRINRDLELDLFSLGTQEAFDEGYRSALAAVVAGKVLAPRAE